MRLNWIARTIRIWINRARGYAKVGNVRLPIDLAVLSPNLEFQLSKGSYEHREAKATRLLHREDTVLELGAGLGYISTLLKCERNISRIVAVEANPRLIDYIRKTHALNGARGIDVRHGAVAAGTTGSDAPFHIRNDVRASSLEPNGQVAEVVRVPTIEWEKLLADVKPTAIIMDIEGTELDLLENTALEGVKRLILEIHPEQYGIAGLSRVYAALCRLRFNLSFQLSTDSVLALERETRGQGSS